MSTSPETIPAPLPRGIQRDRLTLASYAGTAIFTMLLGLIGPLMPHLRAALGLGYAQAALHTSAFAGGMIVVGLVGERLVRRMGRTAAIWTGAVGMAVGLSMLALAPNLAVSVAGCAVMGLLGTLLLVVIPAVLAEQHRDRRGIAFAEQNIVAYCGALAAPVVVWALATGVDWRFVGLVGWVVLGLYAAAFHQARIPAPTGGTAEAGLKLPAGYWGFWALLCATVATEFSVLVWSSSYLETVIGLSRENAVLATAVFPSAMVLGRVAGTLLLRRIGERHLVLPSIALGFAGFMLFWQAPSPLAGLVGLFITGLGVANLYPAGIALAMQAAAPATSAAAARASLGSGFAIIAAPLTLGALADRFGIGLAYASVPVLLALAVVAYSFGRRSLPPE